MIKCKMKLLKTEKIDALESKGLLLTPAGASASGTLLGLDISSIIAVLGYHSFQTEKGSC